MSPTRRESGERWQNWAGQVRCTPERIVRPDSESALQSVVIEAAERGDTIRVAGSGHSFSPVVPTDATLVSLARYRGVVDVDPDARQVTVRAGTTLAELNRELANHGFALSNLGDIDRQTVAGALATGTHGTGLGFGVLATQMSGMRVITADGECREWTPDDGTEFRAAQVSLGALGVVSTITLDVVPAYDLCLRRRTVPIEEVLSNPEQFHDAHRQWEFFWFPHTDQALVKTFDEVPRALEANESASGGGDGPTPGGHRNDVGDWLENAIWEGLCRVGTRVPSLAPPASQFVAWTLGEKTTVGPSHEVFANPRDVRFAETEYGVPGADLPAVVRKLRRYIDDTDVPVQFPIECRFVGGDDPLLSPAHGRDSGFIAVHTYHRKSLPEYFETVESICAEYDGRPHWGKRHSKTASELASLYPRWDEFQEIRQQFDPDGVFLNEHLEDVLVE